ncbi:MAG: extracellular solute-binding protein, partial [Anaerolineae bacterium]|nr:extracellular solute-binding protein [Anaerolineae bacterium]
DDDVVAMWDKFGQILDCSNIDVDAASLSWQQATDQVVNGEAAFNIMGDWAAGYMATTLELEPGEGFAWAPSPGTAGVFMMLSDSFGLPKNIKNRDAAVAWLRLLGSKEGQDIFNPLKGSIAAHLDSDISLYNVYSQSAATDWGSNEVVGSLAHGAVAPESFSSDFATIMELFLTSRNGAAASDAAQSLADDAGIGG